MSEWSFLGNAVAQQQSMLNQYHAFGLNYLNRKLENADNMRMWERMNQYNTPAAQLSRLIAAGANPTAAMSAILGGSVGQQTANSPAETGSYTPTDMSHVVSDGVALQQSYDAHELSVAESQLKRAQAMEISSNISRENAYHPYKLQSFMADAARKFFDNNIAFETYGDTLFLLRNQASKAYYDGLNSALDAWVRGYMPYGFSDDDLKDIRQAAKDGHPTAVDSRTYANEFLNSINQAHNAIQSAADEYDLGKFELDYMRRVFQDMVAHDQEQFRQDLLALKSHSSVFAAMSENMWLQFVDYFISKLGGFAQQAGSAYAGFRGFRHR